MAHINLLPWRDWERERLQNEFIRNLVLGIALAGVIVYGVGAYLDGNVEYQESRNAYIQKKIKEKNKKIKEINDLKAKRQQLLARMQVIQELQGNRPVIVRVFDQLVRTLSNGVYYKEMNIAGSALTMEGIAESTNRISQLMRNLDNSEWFTEPNLKGIKEDTRFGEQASTFEMTVSQINPRYATEEEEG